MPAKACISKTAEKYSSSKNKAIMKKYIKPNSRIIALTEESVLLSMSSNTLDGTGYGGGTAGKDIDPNSNRRDNSIWDNE